MKKLIIGLFLFAGFVGSAHADFLTGGNIRDKNVTLHYSTSPTSVIASTDIILIQLSSTTVWPHKDTGQINISALAVRFDKLAASTATIKLGVVTRVHETSGTVKWFYSFDSGFNVSNTDVNRFENPYEAIYKLRVEGATLLTSGTTPFLFSSDSTTNSTLYQNDYPLPTAAGTYGPPQVGDIIMNLSKVAAATMTVTVDLEYHTDRR